MTYRMIVVGTDGSDTATRAVDQAAGIAADDDARLIVVTGFERHDEDGTDDVPADTRWMLTDRDQAERHARVAGDRARALGARDVVVQAVDGPPAEKLIETAEDFGADLVVVGSVGLTGSTHVLLGSVANTVLQYAPADVLVVHIG